jgi:hypothetical protein
MYLFWNTAATINNFNIDWSASIRGSSKPMMLPPSHRWLESITKEQFDNRSVSGKYLIVHTIALTDFAASGGLFLAECRFIFVIIRFSILQITQWQHFDIMQSRPRRIDSQRLDWIVKLEPSMEGGQAESIRKPLWSSFWGWKKNLFSSFTSRILFPGSPFSGKDIQIATIVPLESLNSLKSFLTFRWLRVSGPMDSATFDCWMFSLDHTDSFASLCCFVAPAVRIISDRIENRWLVITPE